MAGIALRMLLDIHIWPFLIKGLNWIPVRGIFHTNPPNLRGEWDVFWESTSDNFSSDLKRKKTANIYQVDSYCYADYAAGDQRYCMIGTIEESYLTGIWRNIKDAHGYRGAFQLRLVNKSRLDGRWIGFSTTHLEINTGKYSWEKNPS